MQVATLLRMLAESRRHGSIAPAADPRHRADVEVRFNAVQDAR